MKTLSMLLADATENYKEGNLGALLQIVNEVGAYADGLELSMRVCAEHPDCYPAIPFIRKEAKQWRDVHYEVCGLWTDLNARRAA